MTHGISPVYLVNPVKNCLFGCVRRPRWPRCSLWQFYNLLHSAERLLNSFLLLVLSPSLQNAEKQGKGIQKQGCNFEKSAKIEAVRPQCSIGTIEGFP